MAKITLDADTFRALASSTRLTVLKALDERRKTLTELSRDLALNKATVHEHLQLLTAAGLVRKRDDEGRKWIYYELTWTGQRILHPEATTTFNLLLGLSVAAAGGGFLMLGRALGWWLAEDRSGGSEDGFQTLNAPAPEQDSSKGASDAQQDSAERFAMEAPDEDSGSGPYFLDDGGWFALALLGACLVFLVLGWAVRRKLKADPFDADAAAAAESSGAPGSPGP